MSNNKWYLLVDVVQNKATEYRQLPKMWMDMDGMWDLTDLQLKTLFQWSEYTTSSFVSVQEAMDWGVDARSVTAAIGEARMRLVAWLRTMRDPLLAASDVVTISDRWSSYDAVSRAKITAYRQSLRDITSGDLTNVVWPAIPTELDSIRNISIDSIPRPSTEFLECLTHRAPETLESIRADMIERIKNERERRKAGGVRVPIDTVDFWFWTDEPTRNQYSLLDMMVRRNKLPDAFILDNWKTMSGITVPLTVGLLYQIVNMGIQNERTLFKIASDHQAAVLASSDPASYNYLTNWPPTYEEYAKYNPVNRLPG